MNEIRLRTVAWKRNGDYHTAGSSWTTREHLAHVDDHGMRIGSFPCLCGVWVPDAWDAEIASTSPRSRGTCRRCVAASQRGTA